MKRLYTFTQGILCLLSFQQISRSFSKSKLSLLIVAAALSLTVVAQTAPELKFKNPVLKSGTANTQGAIYRFSNVTTGVDAELKLKTFSRPGITMLDVDLNSLGWDKALQPQFGLAGVVPAYQDWNIQFELSFFEAGTNKKQKMERVVLTALDVDGDGWSISEYASFDNPNITEYSSLSNLGGSSPIMTMGANDESTTNFTCTDDNINGKVKKCTNCNGSGVDNGSQCDECEGSGLVYKQCGHPYAMPTVTQGPVVNYANIDTSATQVMVTYTYLKKDKITFKYGATSGANISNGSGIRLNSMWGKQFNLAPWAILPVTFSTFSVMNDKGNAMINWQTAKQENVSHFIVQRSTDGKSYTDIATVFAGEMANYAYNDKSVSSATGIVYYRIVSVDKTKETQYSTVKMLRLAATELQTLALSTYPNPVSNQVAITLPDTWQGKPVMLQLYSANGTVAKSIHLGSASQTETMMLDGLAKGLYIVKASYGNEAAQQRIVKN